MAERDTLLRAVQAAQAAQAGDQLAIAVAALDAHDRRRTASVAQSRETDLSATAVRQALEPLPAFERHTAATDWLGDEEIPSDYRTAMIAEASRWYRGIPRDLAADPDEFQEQALGHAYTAASAYGEHALAARREFMTYVGYLTSSAASGLPQVEQERDPQDNPAPTPLPQDVFDNFAPPQNQYNTQVESPNRQSQISSDGAPMIQQVEQMNSSGSGFGSGPERADVHSTHLDLADSYAEVPLGPPGEIPTIPSGAAVTKEKSAPNPILGENMDAGSERRPTAERQAALRFSAYTGPDQDGFRWHIGSDADVDTFSAPYHEKCSSVHWPEQSCGTGTMHTASVAVGYLMSVEDFHRRAYYESQGAAEGTAVLRTADMSKVAAHHNAIAAAFRAEARTEDEIAWLHGYLARVRPVLAGGKDPFGGKKAKPFGQDDEDEEKDAFGQGKKKRKKNKKQGSPNFPEPRQGALIREAPGGGEHAPYKIVHDSDGWHVENELGERKNKKGYKSKGQARKLQKALYVNVPGASESAEKAASRKTAGAKCACGEDADGTCAACDKPVCDEHCTMHDHDRFCRNCSPQPGKQAASQLPQIQQFTDPQGNPDPGGDQLNTAVMWPLNPAPGGDGDQDQDDQGSAREAARSSMTPSSAAVRMFGQMDAMDGKAPQHKDNYPFSNKAHGQYIRGYAATRGVLDGYSDRDPMSKADFHGRTGRGDLHGHYLDAFHEARGRKGGGQQATSSLRRQADTLTKPHESTDDGTAPYNSAQTSPQPWSSNEGSGDYGQGVKDGQDDAAAGEHPTFSDNSSRVSPYVQGYSVGYSGRPPDTGRMDVPGSIGGDSGQGRNEADAQRAFQVSHASLQRQAAQCYGCPHLPHLGQPCGEEGCRHLHNPGEEGAGPGMHARTIGHVPDPRYPGYSMPPGGRPAEYDEYGDERNWDWRYGNDPDVGDRHEGMRRQADGVSEEKREHAEEHGHTLPGTDKFPIENAQDLSNAKHDIGRTNEPKSKVVRYINERAEALGEPKVGESKAASLVADAFVTREAADDPDFRKGYRYAARWKPGMRMVSRGSPAFEAGLYAAIASRPAVQAAWVQAHLSKAQRYPQLASRIEAHASFSRKFAFTVPKLYKVSSTGCYLEPAARQRRTAATSVDLITDGPGTSPDPMGNTPLNGPGTPPPMGGGEDPARAGGIPPYQGAPPPASAPVAPDDVVGQPQEPPQPGGPFTQTFSGRQPGNADLAPAAPNTAGGPGYQNQDAYSGDPMHKPQALAFRQRVQASLAAARA